MSDSIEFKLAEEIRVAPSPDRVVGNFRIDTLLGRGAMGSVFRARHTILEGKTVAVKMLHQHLCSEPQALKRFRQEAEAASSLHHPGIVAVQDFGVTDDGQPYLVMDFVEGVSLSEVLQAGAMDPARALALAAQVCDALQAAHERGLVHRDIKPSNLILTNPGTPDETIKVVDFGIAKVIEESKAGALTQTGEAMGSPPYMSPEQCAARPIDARSDIYSLGCVLYEMIAGRAPFVSDSIFEMVHDHVATMPSSVSTHRRGLQNSVAFDALLLKALAKDPGDRFESAAVMKHAVDELRQHLETTLSFTDQVKSHWTVLKARRTPMKVMVAAGLLILSSFAIFGGVQWAQHLQPVPQVQSRAKADQSKFEIEKQRAALFAARSEWKNAATAYEAAVEAGKPLGTENPEVQFCMAELVKCLKALGKNSEADSVDARLKQAQKFDLDRYNAAQDASEIARLTMERATNPNDSAAKNRLLAKLSAQARYFITVKQYSDATNCANSILALTSPDDAKDFSFRTSALYVLSRADSDAFNFDAADKHLIEISDALKKFSKPDQPSAERAELYQALGRFFTHKQILPSTKVTAKQRQVYMTTAREYFTKAQNQYREVYGETSPYLADALTDEAFAIHASDNFGDSDALLNAAIEMGTSYRGVDDARSGRQYLALADTKLGQASQRGISDDAKEKLAREALKLIETAESVFADQTTEASAYQLATGFLRGRALELSNDAAGAEQSYLRTLDLGLKSGAEHNEAKAAFHRLIALYQQQKRDNDIKALMIRVNPTGNTGKTIVTES